MIEFQGYTCLVQKRWKISDEIDVSFKIPDYYSDVDPWKFRIFHNGDDVTSLSRKGIVYGKVSTFGNIALYYDPETEFSYPSNIDILGNYPNPFNPSTNIYYVVQGEGDTNVNITILDLLGREVRNLYDGIRGVDITRSFGMEQITTVTRWAQEFTLLVQG